jgi:hypothetical protein
MSGLLPRVPSGGQTGTFDNLNVQTLTVSVAGFINTLTVNSMSVGDLDVASVTTGVINGDPNLNIVAGVASVGSDVIVTRTAAQTLTNKTLTAPIISTITNTGTLTLPTATTTLVGRTTTDTLTNKTLTAPIIATISNTGTLTLPTSTDTLVGRATTDTLTNKTIGSTTNTITITSGSLAADNINTVLDQKVKTTNGVTFATVTTQQVIVSTAVNDAIIVRSSTAQNNEILFQNSGLTDQTAFGYDVNNSLHRGCWGYLNSPMVFATNNLERLRIPAGGVANDNSITNILGLSGTTLAYKNNVVDTSTTQTLSNKSFSDAPSTWGGKVVRMTGTQTTTDASTVTLITVPFATSNTTTALKVLLTAYCSAGANAGTGCTQRLLLRVVNSAGTLAQGTASNTFSNPFATALGLVLSGTNGLVQVTGLASNTILWTAWTTAWYS